MSSAKSVLVVVDIFDNKASGREEYDPPETSFLVNYSDHDIKLWFTRTMIWAMSNDKSIEINKASQKDIETMRIFSPRPEGNRVQC